MRRTFADADLAHRLAREESPHPTLAARRVPSVEEPHMLTAMSFEEDKARLVQELVDAQIQIRGQFNMKPKPPVAGPEGESSDEKKPATS